MKRKHQEHFQEIVHFLGASLACNNLYNTNNYYYIYKYTLRGLNFAAIKFRGFTKKFETRLIREIFKKKIKQTYSLYSIQNVGLLLISQT